MAKGRIRETVTSCLVTTHHAPLRSLPSLTNKPPFSRPPHAIQTFSERTTSLSSFSTVIHKRVDIFQQREQVTYQKAFNKVESCFILVRFPSLATIRTKKTGTDHLQTRGCLPCVVRLIQPVKGPSPSKSLYCSRSPSCDLLKCQSVREGKGR